MKPTAVVAALILGSGRPQAFPARVRRTLPTAETLAAVTV
jgi:hypothetical protein